MDAETTPARTALEAWREQGADRLDPSRFRFIEALEARAQGHAGAARRLLDAKLAALAQAYAADVAQARRAAASAGPRALSPDDAAMVPVADADPTRVASADAGAGATAGAAPASADAAVAATPATAGALGHLVASIAQQRAAAPDAPDAPALLDEFRRLWDDVRGDSQLRQSLRPAPADAGPLNSIVLAHRTIARMQQLSPGYARHFLAYVETLGWLERMPGAAAANTTARKPVRSRRPS